MVTGCGASVEQIDCFVWRTYKDTWPPVLAGSTHGWKFCGQYAKANAKQGPVPLCLHCAKQKGYLW